MAKITKTNNYIYSFLKYGYRFFKKFQNLPNIPIEIKINKLKKSLPKETHEITSWSDNFEGYRAICKLAVENDYVFKVFKRSSDYRCILEHLTKKQGWQSLDIIQKEGRDLLTYFPRFMQNDLLGSPFKFNYGVNRFSPTTLRYIKVLMDLKNIFGNLDDFSIVEIGAGYGGQCKIISCVFNYKSYTIVDLDVVLPLIKKYLEKLDVKNVNYVTQSQIDTYKSYDLAVSNYAFAECMKKIQDEYLIKIFNNSKRGYITYNYDGESNPSSPYNKKEIVALLSKVHAIQILKERPKTTPQSFIIIWDDTKSRISSDMVEKR